MVLIKDLVYLAINEENNFQPEIPKNKVDIVYLVFQIIQLGQQLLNKN